MYTCIYVYIYIVLRQTKKMENLCQYAGGEIIMYTYIYICIYMFLFINTYVYTHICICICVHTYLLKKTCASMQEERAETTSATKSMI